jgi:RimJ/RimL family protein N-acetyltransferase
VIETERLILRPWREADREPYAAMMADPEVGYWLGGPFEAASSGARIDRFDASIAERGFGRYAVERLADQALLGHCGLAEIGAQLPVAPGVEIGWAIRRDSWGQGYATEAARAVLAEGLGRLNLLRILAYTSEGNARSQALMAKLGFERRQKLDFDHPALAEDHPLRRHAVFVAEAPGPPSA